MTRVLVLTGYAGSGKTTVLKILELHGIPTLSADAVVHDLLTTDENVIEAIGNLFPQVVVDKTIDRALYLAHVFDHPLHLSGVEDILHPRVYDVIEEFIREHKALNTPVVALEIPLYYETASENVPVDNVWLIHAPESVRQERVLARNSLTLSRFHQLNARQVPHEEKRERADVVISTDVPLGELEEQVSRMIELRLSPRTDGHPCNRK